MKNFIQEQHKQEAVKLIQQLVRIPSVLDEEAVGTPFGAPIQQALESVLAWCQENAFHTYIDPEGYYGYAEIGESAEIFAILCHLDVVPAGDLNEWQSDPFEAVVRNEAIYGRGTQDDKGPTVAALLAVKALVDAGVTFNKRIRFIFGTDEETLWRCMRQYGEKEPIATMGFAPDSSFPLTYAEKGLLQAKLHGKGHPSLTIDAGQAFNVVPAQAEYSGEYREELAKQLAQHQFDYTKEFDKLTVLGVSKHAKDAVEGINAVTRLAIGLDSLIEHGAIQFIAREIGEDATGSQLVGHVEDEPSGKLSFNVAGLTINKEKSEIRLDLRIPVLANKEQIVVEITRIAKQYDLEYEEFDYLAPLYVPLDSELVSTLMAVYQEKTGDQTPPQSSGGATYARTMKNCVAYGAAFPHTIPSEHMENENITLEDLYGAMDIYAEAVYRLTATQQ